MHKAPEIQAVFGIGTALLGKLRHSVPDDLEIKQLFFTVLYIPLLPLGFYLVRPLEEGYVQFLAKYRFLDFFRDFKPRAILAFYAMILVKQTAFIVFLAAIAIAAYALKVGLGA